MTAISVMIVVFFTSLNVSHDTRFISARTSRRNGVGRVRNPARCPASPRSRRPPLPSPPAPKRVARGGGVPGGTSSAPTCVGGGSGESTESSLLSFILCALFDTRPLPSLYTSIRVISITVLPSLRLERIQGYQDLNPDFRFWRPTC